MRAQAEYDEAMRWIAWGLNPYEIARVTGMPRGTISHWKYGIRAGRRSDPCPRCGSGELSAVTYSYLLGLYLGDGYVVEEARRKGLYRLAITQDARYLGLIAECASAIEGLVRPGGLTARFVERDGCIDVVASWRHWPCVFPQHGPGRKHERSIDLRAWQAQIVRAHPRALLRGLIHSDGCRYVNTVGRSRRAGGYRYANYAFSNASSDIRGIFGWACRLLGIRYRESGRILTISRRPDVEKLDCFVGPKV